MKKKSLSKSLVTGLVLLLLVAPVSAFAEETENFEETRQEKELKNPFRAEKENVDFKITRLEQVEMYTPEVYGIWSDLFENAESLKMERDRLKKELDTLINEVWKPFMKEKKAVVRMEIKAFAESQKIRVENGEITREEAAELFDEYILGVKSEFEEYKALKEISKEERVVTKEYFKRLHVLKSSLNQEIKLAVDSGNFEVIPALLNSILDINLELEEHAVDTIDLMKERIEEILAL